MAALRVHGEGDWGVLVGLDMHLYPSREQAMAAISWFFSLGLHPELWSLA